MVDQQPRRQEVQEQEFFQYPPELLQLLIDAIPRLCRYKKDVVLFFHGAGVSREITDDLYAQLETDAKSTNKFEMVRRVLTKLNEDGDRSLGTRREVLKRVTDFEDFSTCWDNDRLPAEGLVARIRDVVNVRDTFTRMNQERESEARSHRATKRAQLQEIEHQNAVLESIKQDFFRLFGLEDPQTRGVLLESVLNRLFEASGILVRQAFTRTGESGEGIVEQVDGVVDIDGRIYFVEMKWLSRKISKGDVSQHLVRLYGRGEGHGIFISYTDYTSAAISECKTFLANGVVVLATLEEISALLESKRDLKELLRSKINRAIIDKEPFHAA